jgi:hypothetical protein
VYGLVSSIQNLVAKDGHVDARELLIAVYTFAVTWKPTSGHKNFIRASWGLKWTKATKHVRSMEMLLENDASTEEIRGFLSKS